MKRVRDDDARRRDRERTEAEARRQADIRGGARGGASGAPSELDVLRAKIDRMQREGGDDLVISALKEKWERMAAEATKLKGVPSGGPRPAEVTDGYSIEQDKDGDGEAEVVIVGKKGTLPRKARRKIRGLFRGGASAGAKTDAASYTNIAACIGVDNVEEILFVTDVAAEAAAATVAGWSVAVALRDGNAPLPKGHGFRTVTTLEGLW